MQTPGLPDTSSICRVCMTAKGEGRTIDLVNLYTLSPSVPEQISLHQMLKAICAPVFDKPAPAVETMPQNACTGCRNDIIAAFRLHQQCIETDRLLGELLTVKQEVPVCTEEEEGDDPFMDVERQEDIKIEALDLLDELQEEGSLEESGSETQEGEKVEAVCKICSESFDGLDALSVHVKDEHSLFLCKECGELCKTSSSLAHHKFKHKEIMACPDCKKEFATVFTMRRHRKGGFCPLKPAESNPSFKCEPCNQAFETIAALAYHRMKHNGPAVCPDCKKSFATRRSLKEHKRNDSCNGKEEPPSTSDSTIYRKRSKQVVCMGCNKLFSKNAALSLHLSKGRCTNDKTPKSTEEEKGPFFCPKCGKQFEKKPNMHVHMKYGYCRKNDASINAKTCKFCNEVQKTKYQLGLHITEMHPEKLLICDICGTGSPSERGLEKHKLMHKDGKTMFSCTICNEEFPTKKMVRAHRISHVGPQKCNVCDKVVFSKTALRSHMLRHTGERNFACEQCPMRFFTYVERDQHMVTHTKVKNYICDTCGSRFTKKNSLQIHVREIHEGKRDFACSQCSYICAKSSQLKRHMLTHTGEKPFKCTLCEQAYAQSNDLTKHVARVHNDGKPYPCDRCDESFRLLAELRQHYSVHVAAGEELDSGVGQVKFTAMAVLNRRLEAERQQQLIEERNGGSKQ